MGQFVDQIYSFPKNKMPISSLPDECFSNVLSYLDEKTLYKCLFVNRYFCKFTIPLIWSDPFINRNRRINTSLINTLLACLNEDEISSLIPCAINFNNNPSPLFEYGKLIKKFSHGACFSHISTLLGLSPYNNRVHDCRIQKLANVIYHMIMRQGSNLQEFSINNTWGSIYIDLPKLSTFTAYEPGITNLKYLQISLGTTDGGGYDDTIDGGYENTIEFLNMVSKSCNGIVDCNLRLSSPFPELFADIIKSQPLERLSLCSRGAYFVQVVKDKKAIYALEFRSETLKELTFRYLDFQDIDLSFMSKLDRLERLELINCKRYLFTKKLHLKELTLCYYEEEEYDYDYDELKITGAMINPLLGEELHTLDFRNIVTPKAVKAVGESCPNLKYLQISINSESSIPPICELSSLKILKIEILYYEDYEIPSGPLIKTLGDNLKFVEYLLLDFEVDLPSFEYFIDNCKANLKKLIIYIDLNQNSRKNYLIHVSNYQKVHNSLKLFGFVGLYSGIGITNEELEIIDLLKNQGVGVKFYDRFYSTLEENILVFSN